MNSPYAKVLETEGYGKPEGIALQEGQTPTPDGKICALHEDGLSPSFLQDLEKQQNAVLHGEKR